MTPRSPFVAVPRARPQFAVAAETRNSMRFLVVCQLHNTRRRRRQKHQHVYAQVQTQKHILHAKIDSRVHLSCIGQVRERFCRFATSRQIMLFTCRICRLQIIRRALKNKKNDFTNTNWKRKDRNTQILTNESEQVNENKTNLSDGGGSSEEDSVLSSGMRFAGDGGIDAVVHPKSWRFVAHRFVRRLNEQTSDVNVLAC